MKLRKLPTGIVPPLASPEQNLDINKRKLIKYIFPLKLVTYVFYGKSTIQADRGDRFHLIKYAKAPRPVEVR